MTRTPCRPVGRARRAGGGGDGPGAAPRALDELLLRRLDLHPGPARVGSRRAARSRTTSTSRSCRCWSTSCCSRSRGSSRTRPTASPAWSCTRSWWCCCSSTRAAASATWPRSPPPRWWRVLGQAWPDVLWPFQIGFLGSLAAGLGALLALDRARPPRRRRPPRSCSRSRSPPRRSASRCWPPPRSRCSSAPTASGAGRCSRRPPCSTARGTCTTAARITQAAYNFAATPAYVAEAAAGAAGALFGLGHGWGWPLLAGLVVLLVLAVRRGVLDRWRLTALIALPLAFWALTGIARADLHEPAAPRYLYPGVALPAARRGRGGARHARRVARRRRGAAGGARARHGRARARAARRRRLPARPGDLARRRRSPRCALAAPHDLQPGFQPAPVVAPQIHAAAYLGAVQDLGSPRRPPPRCRTSTSGRARPPTTRSPAPTASGSCRCSSSRAARAGARRPPSSCRPRGVTIASDGGTPRCSVRRYADVYRPAGGVTPNTARSLTIPRDASPTPWRVRVSASGPVRVCGR